VSRKRLTAGVLSVALTVIARVTVAAPTASLAEFRATACCAEHCPIQSRPTTPNRCCFVGSPASDPASTAPTLGLDAPVLGATIAVLPYPVVAPVAVALVDVAAVRAGPPPWLRSLRLQR
jgi:hypothetical protein